MLTSATIENISKALIKFHAEVGKIIKASSNPFFKSKYASLPDILDSIREPLASSGLVIIQTPTQNNGLTTRLLHSSGEWFEDTYFMQPVKNDPQGLGSLITYQRRYALGSILSLNIDEDDDGNKASTPAKEDGLTWLNKGTEEFTKVVEALKKGYKIEQVKTRYRLSKETETLLNKEING
jgi:hypothetical protein